LSPDSVAALGRLAFAYARAGRHEEARSLLRRLETQIGVTREPWVLAPVYAALGDAGRALEIQEAAYPVIRYRLAHFRCSDIYQLLRNEPWMREYVRPMRYPN
jgi:hypothetical protein